MIRKRRGKMSTPTQTAPPKRRTRRTPDKELTGLEAAQADAKARDAGVLNGVGQKEPVKATRSRKPAGKVRTGNPKEDRAVREAAQAKETAKTGVPQPANGKPTRQSKNELARRVADVVAAEFKDADPQVIEQVNYWIRCLPTGPEGANRGAKRYWPESLPIPDYPNWK
jgi:hypothetical protein